MSVLLSAVERLSARLARLRSARALHPHGTVAAATWTVNDPTSALGRTLGTGSRPAVVRLSRGLGLPRPLPDVHGVAVRMEADGHRVDLLFSGGAGVVSTLLPYRAPGGLVLLGLRSEPGGYAIGEYAGAGGWCAVGTLRLAEPVGDDEDPFDPYLHHHPDLMPVRLLAGVREAAYRGSRRGRSH
ncbi:MAG TPA: hypothetical protein VGE38_15135 [Nocardioides sp.]|uniref:hypothetical protein n=1 Tax=Nocardioides sp. TaxID=35761 RepID=UPI002ED84B4E